MGIDIEDIERYTPPMIWAVVLVGAIIWGIAGLQRPRTATVVYSTRYWCSNHEGEFILPGRAPQVPCPICSTTLAAMEAQF